MFLEKYQEYKSNLSFTWGFDSQEYIFNHLYLRFVKSLFINHLKLLKFPKFFVNNLIANHTMNYTRLQPTWYYLQSVLTRLLCRLVSSITAFDCEGKSVKYEFTPFGIINFKFVRILNITPKVLALEEDWFHLQEVVLQ